MSARARGRPVSGRGRGRGRGRGGQQLSRSLDVSSSPTKSLTRSQDTPKSARSDVTPGYQTPATRDASSERVRSAMRASRLFNVSSRTPGRRVQATPFRTPRLATLPRQRATNPSVKKADAQLWKDHLKALLKKTLKTCNLSSLSNFKYHTDKLRVKYERTLTNKVLEAYPSPHLEVTLTPSSCLSWKKSVVDAVWLQVSSLVPGDDPKDDKMVVVYSAWLICSARVQSSDMANVKWMPVMLYSGRELIHQVVVRWLQGSFACYVTQSKMQYSDFLWIAGVWSSNKCLDSAHNQGESKVQLTYMITQPHGMTHFSYPNDRGKPKFVIGLLLKDVHEAWNRIVGSNKSEVSIEDLQGYLSAFNSVVATISGLPLSMLKLHQVQTPCVSINSAGKVRLFCQRSVTSVVKSFVDVFLQRTTSYKADQSDYKDPDFGDTIEEMQE